MAAQTIGLLSIAYTRDTPLIILAFAELADVNETHREFMRNHPHQAFTYGELKRATGHRPGSVMRNIRENADKGANGRGGFWTSLSKPYRCGHYPDTTVIPPCLEGETGGVGEVDSENGEDMSDSDSDSGVLAGDSSPEGLQFSPDLSPDPDAPAAPATVVSSRITELRSDINDQLALDDLLVDLSALCAARSTSSTCSSPSLRRCSSTCSTTICRLLTTT